MSKSLVSHFLRVGKRHVAMPRLCPVCAPTLSSLAFANTAEVGACLAGACTRPAPSMMGTFKNIVHMVRERSRKDTLMQQVVQASASRLNRVNAGGIRGAMERAWHRDAP